MRGLYGHLYQTPYLYSSETLKRYYNGARNNEEIEAIQHYMEHYDVFDQKCYKGYLELTRNIQEDLFVPEIVEWQSITSEYTPLTNYDGTIQFLRNDKLPKWLLDGF